MKPETCPPLRRLRQLAAPLIITLTIGTAALCASANCSAQNSPVNGDFDTNLDGWVSGDPPPPTWADLDYTDNPGSGSVNLVNDATEVAVRLYPLGQCFALEPGTYTVEASGYLPPAQPNARLVVSYTRHFTTDCSGGVDLAGGFYVGAVGAWQRAASISLTLADVPISYMKIILGIEKEAAGGSVEGYIDAVHVLGDALFTDGFDDG